MSQTVLANALKLTFQQVQKYEKGANRIGASRLQQIGATLKVPVSFFFEGAPGGDVKAAPGQDIMAEFMCLPYAVELATLFVAIKKNQNRKVVVDVARAVSSLDDDFTNVPAEREHRTRAN